MRYDTAMETLHIKEEGNNEAEVSRLINTKWKIERFESFEKQDQIFRPRFLNHLHNIWYLGV